jgi:hypothetical protein
MKNKLLIIGLLLSLMFFAFLKLNPIKNIDKIHHQEIMIDSLKAEIFQKNIEIGRYEIIMDNLLQTYPKIYDSVTVNVE